MLYQPVSIGSGRHPWGATHFIPPLIYASFISPPSVLLAIPDGDKPLAIPPPCVIGRTSPVRPWWRLFALSAYGLPGGCHLPISFRKVGQ
ncbi:uncharacterized protein UTRI_04711 [Ustilago trichophora]|uniref:Uncharacterized protein n=1 Tax=Ustilago trichophora TaxID=86804 RepID=A0A5C3ECB9_9BASI|nr:uncharacterized protein UTRI_04711 [Ustilago trichophora]